MRSNTQARIAVLTVLGIALAGCISTPQTKALITPIGVVGVHSFAPPRQLPRDGDSEQRVAQRDSVAPKAL